MSAVLEVSDLTRTFGKVVANEDIHLRVQPGEVVGLLGHNGAGKTTLVSQLVGLLRPDRGAIRVAGIDAIKDPAAARRAVALQPQAQAPLDGLTPKEAIEIAARLRGLSTSDARAAALRLADDLDIGEWFTRRAVPEGGLSGGARRLTAFAMAAVAPVPLVVLDEPTNDVDASRRRLLWQTVRRLGDQGAGVLLVTHNVLEAERVVDSLVLLDRGRVVATGTPRELRGTRDNDLHVELFRTDAFATEPVSPPLPVVRQVTAGRRTILTIAATHAATAVAWAASLRDRGEVESYAISPTTLEDTYLSITSAGDELAEATKEGV